MDQRNIHISHVWWVRCGYILWSCCLDSLGKLHVGLGVVSNLNIN